MADEVRRVADEGLPRGHVLREPVASSAARASTPTTGTRSWQACEDEGTVVCLHIGSSSRARDHVARRADRRDDHAAADEHRAGRGRPDVVAGAAEVPEPAGSRCPRAASAGSRTSSSASTTCTSTTSAWTGQDFGDKLPSEVFHEHVVTLLHRRPGRRRAAATASASTRSRGSATTRTPTPTWPNSPETVMKSARRPARRRRSTRSPTRTRCGTSSYDPFAAPAEGAVHRRRAAGRGARRRRGHAQPAPEEVEHRHLVVRQHRLEGAPERLTSPSRARVRSVVSRP